MDKIPIKQYARSLRKNQTRGERALWGLRLLLYFPQRPIGGYIPDFYSPLWLVAVEVQGSIHQTRHKKKKDKTKRKSLRKHNHVYTLYISDEDAQKYPHIFLIQVIITSILWRTWVGVKRKARRIVIT